MVHFGRGLILKSRLTLVSLLWQSWSFNLDIKSYLNRLVTSCCVSFADTTAFAAGDC